MKTTDPIFHPEIDLMPCLRDIPGVTFSTRPTFVIDWDTMKVYSAEEKDKGMYVCAKARKQRDSEDLVKFVEANKKNIVIHNAKTLSWFEMEGVFSDPRPLMWYVKRPDVELLPW